MLSANRVLDREACKVVRSGSALLPLLHGPLRDLQPQRRLALREIFPFAPPSQLSREHIVRSFLMLKMSRPGSVSHSARLYVSTYSHKSGVRELDL